MYSRLSKGIAWLSMILLYWLGDNIALAANSTQPTMSSRVEFSAQPTTCVALHQGRTCYTQVTLQWQTQESGNFCIYQKVTNKIIQCWKNSRINQAQFNFEADEKVEFQLVETERNIVVAETFVEVSWVHKASPRKRRWRLF
ncbi:DUF3019 domain-containing protein [Thalassotalea fusca]